MSESQILTRPATHHAPDIGRVHSVESGGMIDGPGVRFVMFLSGCPLRCLYCHNPDTASPLNGELRNAASLIEEIRHQRPFLKGVTISGGEPLAQPEFCKEIFRGVKKMGLHTAIDTSGHLGEQVDDELMNLTDLWLLDIKSSDPATHLHTTGVDREPARAFARRMAAAGRLMWIRFVLVPGLTDARENIEGVAEFAASLGPVVERIEVLPFHQMGRHKWDALGRVYQLADTPPASPEEADTAREIFRQHGAWPVF
ncbi:MAG: pyruvate formate-lyase-activating protein [Luteolibacter sp.]